MAKIGPPCCRTAEAVQRQANTGSRILASSVKRHSSGCLEVISALEIRPDSAKEPCSSSLQNKTGRHCSSGGQFILSSD